jgi:hypothetical protein
LYGGPCILLQATCNELLAPCYTMLNLDLIIALILKTNPRKSSVPSASTWLQLLAARFILMKAPFSQLISVSYIGS